MSISTRIEAIEQHLTDDYSVLTLAGADLTNVDKNIVNLKPTWQERLLYFINNGTDDVWNNWEKVVGEGTTLTLNNTEEAPMSLVYKGNTSQDGTPTPETPQDIHVVSGDNSIDVCGKNLFDKDTTNVLNAYINGSSVITSSASDRSYWLPIQKNTNYTIKMTQFALSTSQYIDDFQCGLFATTPVLSLTGNRLFARTRPSATQDYTFTETFNSGNYDYLVIKVGNNTRTNITESLKTLQLEVGNEATTYEPYKGASYPITLPEGMFLGWIPNTTYQDNIFKNTPNTTDYNSDLEDNVWYVKKEISKKSNLSSYYHDLTTNYNNLQYIRIDKMTDSANYGNSNNIPVVFTHGIYQVITAFDQAVNIGRITSSGSYSYFYFGVDKTTTIEQAQTLLSNATIYYPLATPTYTEITDSTLLSQLEAVKRSYEGQTNISQNNTDLPFIINVTALKEIE